ncbi:hypothetical protein QAD02_011793 [Eretmocerus hayati]|uniref:Uncharacterized protein n=1 Tax=Eretmocerus hayati TaxID=131215 RepID=A0ACC2NY11_9HYME|nr:hypothetical protein QAD02_011793 [Eretmocerus hayati]
MNSLGDSDTANADDESKQQLGDGTNEGDAAAAKDGEAAAGGGDKATTGKEPRRNILQAIRKPLSSVFSRKIKETDAELGTAGLASVETLDDAEKEKNATSVVDGDGMETVRLDAEAGDEPPTKPHPFLVFFTLARRNILASAATLCILLLVIVIIGMACLLPRSHVAEPIFGDKILTWTSCGPIQGLLEDHAYAFRGIPYAVPPTGDRRFTPSVGLHNMSSCYSGTYKAYNASQSCWQRHGRKIDGSEDCLYLDVFTPTVRHDTLLSVVVLIGADTFSGPSPGIMRPSALLAHQFDMVFVRPNFRLDVLGFLAAEPLSRTRPSGGSGNYGLSDLVTALNWVNLNIENFGGDKSKVTIWGHRAGGTLAAALIGSHKAKGLFQNVWISSGSANFPMSELRDSEKQNKEFLDAIGCEDSKCLRDKPAETLMEAVPPSWYVSKDELPEANAASALKHEWLVKDGVFVREHMGDVWKSNFPAKVILGSTAQSGQLPANFNYNTTYDPQLIKKVISDSLIGTKGLTEAVLTKYETTLKGLHTMISDIRVVCPLFWVTVSNKKIPMYVSRFPRDGKIADVDSDAAAILGIYPNATVQQRQHLGEMQKIFKQFVWNGKVDKIDQGMYLFIDEDVIPHANIDICNYWIHQDMVPNFAKLN